MDAVPTHGDGAAADVGADHAAAATAAADADHAVNDAIVTADAGRAAAAEGGDADGVATGLGDAPQVAASSGGSALVGEVGEGADDLSLRSFNPAIEDEVHEGAARMGAPDPDKRIPSTPVGLVDGAAQMGSRVPDERVPTTLVWPRGAEVEAGSPGVGPSPEGRGAQSEHTRLGRPTQIAIEPKLHGDIDGLNNSSLRQAQ